jgi:hypothetical protein
MYRRHSGQHQLVGIRRRRFADTRGDKVDSVHAIPHFAREWRTSFDFKEPNIVRLTRVRQGIIEGMHMHTYYDSVVVCM